MDVEESSLAASRQVCDFPTQQLRQHTQTKPPHKVHRSPSPTDNNSRLHRQHRRHFDSSSAPERTLSSNVHDSPNSQSHTSNSSGNSHSHPSSRATMLVFLLFAGIAIAHAIATGFENMHESKQKQAQHQIMQQQAERFGNDGSNYFAQNMDDAVSLKSSNANNMANNEAAYDNRSVNANKDPSSPEDANSGDITATILSRTSQLSSLISNLDASDQVECYVVTRMAHLTNMASNFGGGSNAAGGNGNRKVQSMLDESMASSSTDIVESKVEESAPTSSSSASTTNTPSGPVLIRKSALAFRYRPRVASASHGPHFSAEYLSSTQLDNLSPGDQLEQQKYFELTLEYGPQRTGAARTSESMPMVRMDMELMAETSNNNNIGKYVSWENEGRVYHSTQISNEWTEAYYMAPITGVVLDKIIQRAVEYTYKRPRYQPFEVISKPSGNLILRSSGSDDFVWDMFRDLADLFVDIDPLLVPPRGRVQFYVADPEGMSDEGQGDGRRESGSGGDDANDNSNGDISYSSTRRKQPNPNVKKVKGPLEGSRAAVFYENFFNCANAIKTGDYSMYLPPPSLAPTLMPTVSMVPSMAPSIVNGTNETTATKKDNSTNYGKNNNGTAGALDAEEYEDNPGASSHVEKGDHEIPEYDLAMLKPSDNDNYGDNYTTLEETDDDQFDDQSNKTGSLRHRYLLLREKLPQNQRQLGEKLNNSTDETVDTPETNPEDVSIENEEDDISGLTLRDDDFTIDSADTEGSEDDPAEAAEKAAIEAAKAAENAAAVVATNTSSAADTAAATNEAAKAAVKAKDASVAARSSVSAEALLSGDGELMTSVLSSCFSDPKYGMRIQKEIHHDTEHADGNDSAEGGNEEKSGNVVEMQDMTFAYIYLDGDVFIRLNLTSPYWGTVSELETVPPPHIHPEGHGDAIDWAIFMLILMGTLFGFLVMVHQVGIVIDKRLRFRQIFHPTMNESDWASDDECGGEGENSPLKQGGGFSHSELKLTVESIPTSMGGKGGSSSPTIYDHLNSTSLIETADSNNGLDLEMAQRSSSSQPTDRSSTPKSSSPRKGSFGGDKTQTNALPESLRMRRDTPDLVERPSSKSFSKVALPQQSPEVEESGSRKLEFNRHGPPDLPLDIS
mmetsp:Transcript_7499/g.17009  ORF Transcript_7499/g.17009 Transcript_7499/m.17009 type:complete len:1132 (+) Transcript_7499:74-3469(+)